MSSILNAISLFSREGDVLGDIPSADILPGSEKRWWLAAWPHVLPLHFLQGFPLNPASAFWGSLHSVELIIIRGTEYKEGKLWRPSFVFHVVYAVPFMEIPKGYLIQVSWHLNFFIECDCLFFLLINVIVVISFSVSKLLNCREFKQLVKVRDSRGALKVLFPFAYITCTRA